MEQPEFQLPVSQSRSWFCPLWQCRRPDCVSAALRIGAFLVVTTRLMRRQLLGGKISLTLPMKGHVGGVLSGALWGSSAHCICCQEAEAVLLTLYSVKTLWEHPRGHTQSHGSMGIPNPVKLTFIQCSGWFLILRCPDNIKTPWLRILFRCWRPWIAVPQNKTRKTVAETALCYSDGIYTFALCIGSYAVNSDRNSEPQGDFDGFLNIAQARLERTQTLNPGLIWLLLSLPRPCWPPTQDPEPARGLAESSRSNLLLFSTQASLLWCVGFRPSRRFLCTKADLSPVKYWPLPIMLMNAFVFSS
jgi:hypothetical protein